MTKKLIEKIKEKEKEKELRRKKDQKSLQRNKTVSTFRTPARTKDRARIQTDNIGSRTLKANKSMGHFLRKNNKSEREKNLDLNLEKTKKKIDLKYISRTPKRSEKANSFYSKTDARTNIHINKNNMNAHTINKKSEKRLITNLTLKGKDEKDKDKNKKIIKKEDKKEDKKIVKNIDLKAKHNKRPSKQLKPDKDKDKKDGKIEKNKDIKKLGDKTKDKKEVVKDEKNKDNKIHKEKKESTKKSDTTKHEKKPKEEKIEKKKIVDKIQEKKKEEKKQDKKEEKTDDKKKEEKTDDKKKEEKIEDQKKEEKIEDQKKEEKIEDQKIEDKIEDQKIEENKPQENVEKEKDNKIIEKNVEEKKEEEKKENPTEAKDDIKPENSEKKEEKIEIQNKSVDNKIEISSPSKIDDNQKISKVIFHRLMNFYDKIQGFLSPKERNNLLLICKDSAMSILPILKETNSLDLQQSEKELNDFKSKHKEEEYSSTIPQFQLSKVVIKSLEKLNEEASHKLFTSEETPNKYIIYVYRVFLQLLNKDNELNNKNDKIFWKSAKDIIFTNRKGQLSDHIKDMATQIDFSAQNLSVVNNMYKQCKDIFAPKHFNNICLTTGYFSVLIREILEFCGIMEGKKTCFPLKYKILDYEFQLYKKREEKLSKMSEMDHKKKSLFNKS